MSIKLFLLIVFSAVFNSSVLSQQEIVVTPTNTHGWTTADTRPGGTVTFVADPTAPSGNGALRLTTDATVTSKAQFMHDANTPLANVTQLSYYTKQTSGPPHADPSYQLVMCLNGVTASGCTPGGFTTLVFEPYQNPQQGAITTGLWQDWDVYNGGLLWSTRTVTCSNGVIVGTSGGPATYTISQIKTLCPNAIVVGYGVNIGTFNPMYDVSTDLFNFNGTIYDFELYRGVRNNDECKNGGWRTLTREDGTPFRNQGDCVSYANNNRPQ